MVKEKYKKNLFMKSTDCTIYYYQNLKDDARTSNGFIYTLAGEAIPWFSRLQRIVTLSTTEAEYILAMKASKEAIWLTLLCSELGLPKQIPVLHCLAKNPVYHATIIYIDICNHVNSEVIEDGQIQLAKINTTENLADCLTKCLRKTLHEHYLEQGGVF